MLHFVMMHSLPCSLYALPAAGLMAVAVLCAVGLIGYLSLSPSRAPGSISGSFAANRQAARSSLGEALAGLLLAGPASIEGLLAATGLAHAAAGELLNITNGYITSPQRRELMQLQQDMYCRCGC